MELNFKKKVMLFCLIALVIVLFIILIVIRQKSSNVKWPPYVSNCPDYWLDLSSNGSQCLNIKKLGTCNIPTKDNNSLMDFTTGTFTSSGGQCNKQKWANTCGVTWDGITYGYGKNNPCSESDGHGKNNPCFE
jgi:hypothetical protein